MARFHMNGRGSLMYYVISIGLDVYARFVCGCDFLRGDPRVVSKWLGYGLVDAVFRTPASIAADRHARSGASLFSAVPRIVQTPESAIVVSPAPHGEHEGMATHSIGALHESSVHVYAALLRASCSGIYGLRGR